MSYHARAEGLGKYHKMFINIYMNPKTRNWFRYETFIHLFEFKGFSTWGERDTIFLCWLLLHRQLSTQPTRGARSAQICLASTPALNLDSLIRRQELNSLTFSKSQNLQPTLPGMTAFTPTSPISYLGFLFWHLWMTHPPCMRRNTCAQCCT